MIKGNKGVKRVNSEEKGRKMRVLIVDDTPDNVWVLADTLKDGYTIMVARDGISALSMARQDVKPDLILLDVLMPDMNGYTVCSQLKSDDSTKDIPVIFVTSQGDSLDEEKGLALGAVDYIRKPFVPSLVRARVRTHLELKQHRDNLNNLVRERTQELESNRQFIISALATLAEWRDPDTGAHIYRTKKYVNMLAVELQKQEKYASFLTDEMIEIMTTVAPMHDIGKVCISDAILLKPGPLTKEEFDVMKQHTTAGRDIIRLAGGEVDQNIFLHTAIELVYSHHERWDGTGYPVGVREEDIPLVARIMSLADVYDALVSKRVYKPAFTHDNTVEMIISGRGTQFCPSVVDAFLTQVDAFASVSSHIVQK